MIRVIEKIFSLEPSTRRFVIAVCVIFILFILIILIGLFIEIWFHVRNLIEDIIYFFHMRAILKKIKSSQNNQRSKKKDEVI